MDKLKTIAMYLPQYHNVPENNQWWGDGFTEWTAVKGAEKLFEGHNQPREPLDNDYYDLMEKSTMERQADIAEQYGIDGFCFYHYYFKEGRKILEKPAENLLSWEEINIPFCFCWANESWTYTWSKLRGANSWSAKYEKANIELNDEKGVLLEQKYGREVEWRNHFQYMLPFFKDKRYIKLDEKPLFLIYKPSAIYNLAEMISYWNSLALNAGLKGIYVIGLNRTKPQIGLDAILINGPTMYWGDMKTNNVLPVIWRNKVKCYDYRDVWKNALKAKRIENTKTFFGAFVDFDVTPRHGKRGMALDKVSVEIFREGIYELAKKNISAGNDILFINAFNEWGEGMYLEPDKKNGYGYLEAVKQVKGDLELISVIEQEESSVNKQLESMIAQDGKEKLYFYLLDQWMFLRGKGINLSRYLERYGFRRVAIYGVGNMGKHLITELSESSICIEYGIDKRQDIRYSDIEVKSIEDDLPEVDAVIVTAVFYFDEIWSLLRSKVDFPIVSLEEIISESL